LQKGNFPISPALSPFRTISKFLTHILRGIGVTASSGMVLQWQKATTDEIVESMGKLAKKGLTPSQIGERRFKIFFPWTFLKKDRNFILFLFLRLGVILRDSHGVAQVRFLTGSKILRILKAKGLGPDLPEDLYHLVKKAVAIRKHLERNRKVCSSLFHLFLLTLRYCSTVFPKLSLPVD
jgi:ribosomal protein S15P/S13E